MFKLLNRFAWLIAILITIAIISIDWDLFIFAIIAGIITKFVFLSDNFIEDRLQYFANSIKNNYLGNEEINNSNIIYSNNVNSPIIPFHKGDKDKIKEETINLEEIKQEEISLDEQIRIQELREQEEIQRLENEKLEEEKEQIADIRNNQNYTQEFYEPNAFDIFLEKIGTYIKEFFSTNLLAKLGGILVFLAVVYFLKGVVGDIWEIIGPVGRIALGIIIGFITYFIGVKIHSNYKNEGLILMGVGILINFAVILSGRYLVGEGNFLSEGITFIFLILNTIFAVLTSLIYKSKTLLIFSFIFAYLNPILTGGSSETPYTLIGYSLIVSLGALYISIREANLTLLIISFIAGNLLFLGADFSDSIGWSAKIVFTSILSIISIIAVGKFKGLNHDTSKIVLNLFIGTYIFIILNLLNSTTTHTGMLQVMGNALESSLGFIIYNFILISLFIFSIKLVKNSPIIPFYKGDENNNSNYLSIFIFIPLIILIGILFSGNMIFSPFVLIGTIITYLIGFIFLGTLSNIFSYLFFGILAIFIFIFNLDIINIINIFASDPRGLRHINITEFTIIITTSLIFLLSTYFYSLKENLSKLFPIGTIGTILILSPIIKNDLIFHYSKCLKLDCEILTTQSNLFMILSIIAIIIFALSNLILPFLNKNLFKKENLNSLIIGSLAGALFFAFEIYSFGEIHFPGVIEGFAFLGLAIVYFMQGFFVGNKIGFEKMKSDESLKNIFYTFIAISISLFSVAIAFVFSNYPEIITTTWLFEATILYFFYSKNSNPKIFWAATILFIIGLGSFGNLINEVKREHYLFLISFSIILSSFMLNLFFINKAKKDSIHNLHHILHIIGMLIMGILLYIVIPSSGHGWSLFGISAFITLLGVFYAKFNFKLLKIIFLIIIAIFGILHIGALDYVFGNLQNDNLESLKILQYIVTAIIISNIFIWNKLNEKRNYNKILLIIISIYAFIISNLFILDLFENIFGNYTLTIYWGLIASALLIFGIQKDLIKYRTIGLYFLTLTTAKIFLLDVWEISDTNSRVAVFAILGVIFIIISTLYTKRFGDNLTGEFSLDNLKDKIDKKSKDSPIISVHKRDENNISKKEEKVVNVEIENIDVSDIKSVKFKFNNGKSINIRAVNLVKITKLLIDQNGKTEFEAGELTDIFKFIKSNYRTELSKDNYEKIIDILKKFVKEGGEVELVKK